MSKTLVYVFGPDGAGKSTLSGQLTDIWPGSLAFNASRPAEWPDTSWHEEAISSGIRSDTLNPAYYFETIARCYRMADAILRLGTANPVIIDSDLRSKIAVKAGAWYGHTMPAADIYTRLSDIAARNVGADITQIGVHATIGQGTPEERAAELMRRVSGRKDEATAFDPASLEAAQSLLIGFDGLEALLTQRREPFVRIETDRPINITEVAEQILATH